MLEKDDEKVWKEALEGVQKLSQPDVVPCKKKKTLKTSQKQKTLPADVQHFDRKLEIGTSSDIDKQTLRRFKKEEMGVEATLDLHGMTLNVAFAAVYQFVLNAYHQGKRAVLIITGKGLNPDNADIFETKGVLHKSVPLWLESENLRGLILTYIHPSSKLGGKGALYLLIRKKRS
ncbi:MAG: Smr/MutS family protein [Alphaproteobacteria bacterium]|nr:Smr/MutS family protein [Alphaproteobacteria bacterium]